jgi:site-specific recombinase XerD
MSEPKQRILDNTPSTYYLDLATDLIILMLSSNKQIINILTPRQVQLLRSVYSTITPKNKRDAAILDVFLYLGLRLKEVTNLRLEYFQELNGEISIVLQNRVLPLPIHPTLKKSLNLWMDQRGMSLLGSSGPIFPPIRVPEKYIQKSLGSQTISLLVAKYGNAAGIAPLKGRSRLKPSDLRRTCARNAFDHGADLVSIQAFLGFNHLETVTRYIKIYNKPAPDSVIDCINYKG